METIVSNATISFKGRFTFADHAGFRDILGQIAERSGRDVTIDLSGLEFIDSAGLGMLLMARETADREHVHLTLKGARGSVARMLETARFDTIFSMAS